MNPGDYARASALVLHAMLIRSIESSFPTLTIEEQNDIVIDILDRTARMRGWGLKREGIHEDADSD
jgi:hypothetical protein